MIDFMDATWYSIIWSHGSHFESILFECRVSKCSFDNNRQTATKSKKLVGPREQCMESRASSTLYTKKLKSAIWNQSNDLSFLFRSGMAIILLKNIIPLKMAKCNNSVHQTVGQTRLYTNQLNECWSRHGNSIMLLRN